MTLRLSFEDCVALFEAEIHAGALVDPGKLRAAIDAPFAGMADGEFFPTLIEKGARLAFGIAQAQAFQDGNKRLAWLSTVVFFQLNGVDVEVDHDEAARVIRALGEYRPDGRPVLDLDGLTAWFVDAVR